MAKTFAYKIYQGDSFLYDLPNVTSEFQYSQDINSAGTQIEIQFAKSFDDVGAEQVDTFLVDEAGNNIVDELGNNIVVRKEYEFGDIPIDLGNRVLVYMYDTIHPNGLLVFDGLISKWSTSYSQDFINLTVVSWGVQLDNYVLTSNPSGQSVVQESYNAEIELTHADPELTTIIAQSFNLSGQTIIGSFTIVARRSGVATGSTQLWGLHYGTPVAPGPPIAGGFISIPETVATIKTITLPTPAVLPAGNYHWVFGNGGGAFSTFISYSNANPYASGKLYSKTGIGGTYAEVANGDAAFVVYSSSGSTNLAFTEDDPSNILRDILDQLNTQGGTPYYDDDSIDSTTTLVTYTYKVSSIYEAIQKVLDLAPDGWYWYLNIRDNLIHFHQIGSQADHLLVLGDDFVEADIEYSLESVINLVHFSGGDTGSGDNLYSIYTNPASQEKFGQWLQLKSDNRVTIQATADTIGSGILNRFQDAMFQISVQINSARYDIETFMLGQMVGFQNFNNLLDTIVYQIVRIERLDAENIRLQLGNIPPRASANLDEVNRRLNALDTIDNSDTPT